MQFANPSYLWLLLVIIPLTAWYIYKQRKGHPTLAMSSLNAFTDMAPTWRVYMRHLLFVLRMGAIGCLIVLLARPLLPENEQEHRSVATIDGTDIIVALDISSSMLARDFEPNRLEAAKRVATNFINGRPDDNMGLVIFAGESLTALPLTNDRENLTKYIASINIDIDRPMLEDGTAIGDGIGTSINAILNGKAKSKSIILITDGSNNTGVITPRDAGLLAKENNIKVYTIGIGTQGEAPYPAIDQFGRKTFVKQKVVIEEPILKDIAKETGGKYFRATDEHVLSNVFDEIDQLETTEMDVEHFSHTEDDPGIWPWLAFGLLALELTLRFTALRMRP